MVIEAVTERIQTKVEVYEDLLNHGLRSDCILASNTSSISITKLAGAVTYPERVIGMHFMNPVPVMPLVEIIKGLQTSD